MTSSFDALSNPREDSVMCFDWSDSQETVTCVYRSSVSEGLSWIEPLGEGEFLVSAELAADMNHTVDGPKVRSCKRGVPFVLDKPTARNLWKILRNEKWFTMSESAPNSTAHRGEPLSRSQDIYQKVVHRKVSHYECRKY